MNFSDSFEQTVQVQKLKPSDLVVAGAGTAGTVAAIAAGRLGIKTTLVEASHTIGGMMTFGNAGLTKFIPHTSDPEINRQILVQLKHNPQSVQVIAGIAREIIDKLLERKAALATENNLASYVFTDPCAFSMLLLELLEEAGVQLILNSPCVAVMKSNNRIDAVIMENKSGRQALTADVFIDATGDADLAYRAGAELIDDPSKAELCPVGAMYRAGNVHLDRTIEFLQQHPDRFVLHPFSLMTLDQVIDQFHKKQMVCFSVKAGGHDMQIYNSPDPFVCTLCCSCGSVNATVAKEKTSAQIQMMRTLQQRIEIMRNEVPGFENAFLIDMPTAGVRETRRVRGDYILTDEDVLQSVYFEDTVARGSHPVDIRPVTERIKNFKYPPDWTFSVPYRSLIARDLDNLLLAGRCISATHHAAGSVRVTSLCMATGQAAGMAAALSVFDQKNPREIDIQKLKKSLQEQNVIL